MALFRSRYSNYLITLPDRRGLRFMNGRLETHVPDEVALCRAICKAEARGNAAVQELGTDGLALPHARQGLGPDTMEPTTTSRGKRAKKLAALSAAQEQEQEAAGV